MTIVWSRHSVRIERTTRSPMAFARGARTGVRTLAMPSQPGAERAAVDSVAVVDEVFGLASPGSRPDQLPPDPGRGRTRGHVEVDQLTKVVPDEEEDIEDPVVNGVDHQQIGRPDSFELVGEERPPGLAAAGRRLPPAIAPDGSFAHDDPELEELTAYRG